MELCRDPAIAIEKDHTLPDDCTDAGDKISYTYAVSNTGNVALAGVSVVDDKIPVVATLDGDGYNIGDLDQDGLLDTTEVWEYTGTYEVTQEDVDTLLSIDNHVTANAVAAIGGEAADEASDDDTVELCRDPAIAIEKDVLTDISGTYVPADDPDGPQASTSSTVFFRVTLNNTGNVALTGIMMADSIVHNPGGVEILDYNDPALNVWVDLNNNQTEDAGEDWATLSGGDMTLDTVTLEVGESVDIYYSLTSVLGQHENTATVTAQATVGDETTGPVSDDANYYVLDSMDCVGVGTPGFWSNNGFVFWDGIVGNESKHAGQPGFAEGELLYDVFLTDTNLDGTIDNTDTASKGLLIGDYNQNGITDAGEDTIFIAYADAVNLINASNRQVNGGQADGIWMVGRDAVATWLNFLANNPDGTESCIGQADSDGNIDPREAIDAAVDWMQQYASTSNADDTANPGDTNTNTNFHDAINQAIFEFDGRIATKSAQWKSAETEGPDLALSGSQIHSALDAYNNTGEIDGVEYCCDRDDASAMYAVAQVNAYEEDQLAMLASSIGQSGLDQQLMMQAQALVVY